MPENIERSSKETNPSDYTLKDDIREQARVRLHDTFMELELVTSNKEATAPVVEAARAAYVMAIADYCIIDTNLSD